MDYTVEMFFGEFAEEGLKCITEGMDLSKHVIEFCFPHELPMQGFIRPGELVLTSAQGGRGDPDIFIRTVQEASADHASAVMFSFPSDIQIPVEAIELAQNMDLPLLLENWERNFTDIQEFVSKAIHEAKTKEYIKLQSRMFNAYFEGKTLVEAIDIIAGSLAMEAATADWSMEVLAQSSGFHSKTHEFKIEINGQLLGFLWLQTEDVLPEDINAIIGKYISYPLALWLDSRRVEAMTEIRLRNDLAIRLCREKVSNDLAREAGRMGISLDKTFVAVHIVPKTVSTELRTIVLHSSEIIRQFTDIGLQEKITIIAGEEVGRFTVFIEYTLTGNVGIDRILQQMFDSIHSFLPDVPLYAGISYPFHDDSNFMKAYQEALITSSYCSDEKRVIHYEDARKIRIMSAVMGQEQILHDAEELFSKLIAYDHNGGSMELMKTLATYFTSGGNTAQTARELVIHRQSLLARLQKIEDLTGMSLKNPDDRFVMEIYSRLFLNY